MGMEIQKTTSNQPNDQAKSAISPEEESHRKRIIIVAGVVILIAIIILAIFIYLLLTANPSTTAQIRDVFIIFMALESLLVGLVLILLVIQLARLTNLLQNEIKPILESMNETVSTLRGTTTFLSDNLVEPVIKMNEYVAVMQQVLTVLGLARRKNKSKS